MSFLEELAEYIEENISTDLFVYAYRYIAPEKAEEQIACVTSVGIEEDPFSKEKIKENIQIIVSGTIDTSFSTAEEILKLLSRKENTSVSLPHFLIHKIFTEAFPQYIFNNENIFFVNIIFKIMYTRNINI